MTDVPEHLHWETESVFSEDVEISIGDDTVCIGVHAEVPMRGEVRQARRGNRYYPTLIDVEGPADYTMHPPEARELAQQLIAAADAADAIDTPDADHCGHWFPCGCCRASRTP